MTKIKNLLTALTIGFVSIGFTACSKEEVLIEEQYQLLASDVLPKKVQTQIENLDGYTFEKIRKRQQGNQQSSYYESFLSTNIGGSVIVIKLDFDHAGNWTEAESENDRIGIPLNFLAGLNGFPKEIITFLQTYDLGYFVEEVERKAYGFKLSFLNDTEALFDREGTLISPHNFVAEKPVETNKNTGAEEFIRRYFAGYTIMQMKSEYNNGFPEHTYYIQNRTKRYKIVFDNAQQWIEIEGDEDKAFFIPQSIIDLLPEGIRNYLAKNSKLQVVEIERTGKRFKLELSNDSEVYFDITGKYLRTDY